MTKIVVGMMMVMVMVMAMIMIMVMMAMMMMMMPLVIAFMVDLCYVGDNIGFVMLETLFTLTACPFGVIVSTFKFQVSGFRFAISVPGPGLANQ